MNTARLSSPKSHSSYVMSLLCMIFCALSFSWCSSLLANEDRTKQDLVEVQEEIKRSEARFAEQKSALKRQEKQLRQVERSVAEHVRALELTQQGMTENRQQQQILEEEQNRLSKQRRQLSAILAKQLQSAYINGAHDYSKMLLNQENASTLERMIVYYEYLNNARTSQLDALKEVVAKIDQNKTRLLQKQSQLADLSNEQQRRLDGLKVAQAEQVEKSKALQSTLNATKTAIAYLRDNEKTLRDTLAQLQTVKAQTAQSQEMVGLNNAKGKLPWPVTGRIGNRFGAKKHTGLNWNGVLIQANEGSNVTSIRQGQVVFADWLNGYGWVIVVDHGEGFMSLYGHAQTLLRDVGDLVQSGEPIAKVGQSGGQQNPGLYFEIRHKGRAVNPIEWCRKS
ncbi:murein hydrolase activator EnvC family protein [Pseudoalteromonas xiamenensis]|uniref:murein hydrolase activator EnvC family protein n=2 Tax=Pseudoalteromonas xiamenensis TaxID=882626 RepID=UPI0035E5B690